MRIYVAGPMSGIKAFNFPAFDAAAENLRKAGYDVLSPAEMDAPETRKIAMESPDGAFTGGKVNDETWGDFLARDVKLVADDVDGVALLPGWHDSRGARLEAFVALSVQKPVYEYRKNPKQPLVELAKSYLMDKITNYVINQGNVTRYTG